MRSRSSVRPRRGGPVGRFVRHYVEMVVAMLVGMLVLGPVWALGWPGLDARPAAQVGVMVVDMTLGMGLWMRVRGHAWAGIAEMSGAMAAPFAVLGVPYALGAVSAETLMMGGHLLMFVTMAAAMLRRRADYTGSHAEHRAPVPAG